MRISPKRGKLPRPSNNRGWVKPDPKKVAAITSYPTPTSVKELKTFCRMISFYRRFIPNCSRIAFPIHKLLKKDVKFEWKPEQEHAFQHLKAKLTSQPILQYSDFSKEFILTTDASNTSLGAVLSQGPLGKDFPVAYASRSLNKAEINPYPTAFPYGNGMVLHFYQQQESSTTKTVHKVINKGLKTYV